MTQNTSDSQAHLDNHPSFEKISKQDLKDLLEEIKHHQNFVQSNNEKKLQPKKVHFEENRRVKHDKELLELRDQMSEAKAEDMPALLSEMNRLAALKKGDAPKQSTELDPEKPYFAHLRLEETICKKFDHKRLNEKTIIRDVLIGNANYIDRKHNIVIVDWRHAPVSQIYYRYSEDEDYEDERADEIREGLVLARRTLAFNKSYLARVQTPKGVYRLSRATKENHSPLWQFNDLKQEHNLEGGAGSSPRTLGTDQIQWRESRTLENISALIDQDQFAAMSQQDSGIVILQGGAGSGKTTVALHRVSYLQYQNPEQFKNHRILCVVRQSSLVPYLKHLMPSLGLGNAQVISYNDWAVHQVRNLLGLKRLEISDEAPDVVSRYKKHPALLKAISDYMLQTRQSCISGFETVCRQDGKAYEAQLKSFIFRVQGSKTSLSFFFNETRRTINQLQVSFNVKERLNKCLNHFERPTLDWKQLWQHFLTDVSLQKYLCSDYKGGSALSQSQFHQAQSWHKQQIENNLKLELSNDDLDEGRVKKHEINYQFEHNDMPLLINIHIGIYGSLFSPHHRKVQTYDHIVIDEAQDLSAVELKPLVVSAGKKQSLSLAGDIVQKVVFDNGFLKWKQLIEQLECKATEVKPFRLSYRSSKQITEFAHAILGPLAPSLPPKSTRNGKEVCVFTFDEQGQEVEFISRALGQLIRREPNCSVALLCRYPERAEYLYEQLKKSQIPKLSLRIHDDFSFKAGIEISTIIKAKGLEFDYVICPEIREDMYPENDPSRHLLHIASTRAAYQFWGTSTTKISPIIPEKYIINQD